MPPSPALRCSPGREPKLASKHKRGHSFDSGLSSKAKDDDLTLFNEMRMRETDNFLLHSNEDFDDSLSKLKCFSDFKLGIKIPIRGENSDLLNADNEKTDYDWLLTPPDTPLFPSLDDDERPPSNLVTRGRQSQPVSISRPSMAERNQRPGRTSASPHRRSPSPRPGGSTLQSRGRASSVPHSSPVPILWPATPSQRPSTPPTKPSTPTPRSVTPTLRRTNGASSGLTSSSGRRGASPIKGTRGSSASPKLRGWQSNAPGFSSDAPPNLRTSISDRPSSYSRGSSPVSRNGKESHSRYNRQSMSPTASGSVSSSHSHDCNRLSSHSKGSVVSSGDDDVASLQSLSMGTPVSPTGKKNGVFVNNRTMAFPKKTSRTPSPSSAPKRYFDSALRQMDHRKTPQNMFRPLMSSVPPSSFYGGKASMLHRPIFSRNSSLTTSSNASSEQGASVAPDTECSDHDHTDLTNEWGKTPESGPQEEIFIFDKMEDIREDTKQECCTEQTSINDGLGGGMPKNLESENENSICELGEPVIPATSLDPPYIAPGHFVVDSYERTATCSICGKRFQTAEAVSGNSDVCLDCALKNDLFGAILNKATQLSSQEEDAHHKITDATGNLFDKPQPNVDVLKFPEETCSNANLAFQHVSEVEQIPGAPQENCVVQLTVAKKEENNDKQTELQRTIDSVRSISDYKFQHSQSFTPSSRIDGAEGTGISVLLKRSSSSKGPVVQGRMFTASNLQCAEPSYARQGVSATRLNHSLNSSTASSSLDLGSSKGSVVQGRMFTASNAHCTEPSYARENLSAIKLNHSRNSSTASSSLDLGSSRQLEALLQRQLSSRKGSADCLRNDRSLRSQDSMASPKCNNSLEVLVQNHQSIGHSDIVDFCDSGEVPCGRTLEYIDCSDAPSSSIETVGTEDNSYTKSSSIMDAHMSESSGFSQSSHVADSSLADFRTSHSSNLNDGSEFNQTKERNVTDMEGPVDIASKRGKENESDVFDSRACKTSGVMLEVKDSHDSSQLDCKDSPNSTDKTESSDMPSVTLISNEDLLVSQPETNHDNHVESILEESSVTIESSSGQKSKSLTLEEATDTILFCSSIIHDLAYKAAAIGIEKEQSSIPDPEVSRPTVTILEKPVCDQKSQSKTLSRRTNKSQKVRKKLEAVDVLSNERVTVSDVKVEELYTTDLPRKFESTKPQKLESKCNCTVM